MARVMRTEGGSLVTKLPIYLPKGALWSSQILMDTCLGTLSSGLKFVWTHPTEMLVSTDRVIEHVDVV